MVNLERTRRTWQNLRLRGAALAAAGWRPSLLLVALLVLPAASARAAHPAGPVWFAWWGSNGSGNGSSGDWQNWVRPQATDPDDLYYPAEDGDLLDFGHTLAIDATIHRSITLADHDMGTGNIGFDINADLTGGNLQAATIGVNNISYAGFYPTTTFDGTKFNAGYMEVGSFSNPITFKDSTLTATVVRLYGADHAGGNPTTGAGVTNFLNGSTIDAVELNVGEEWFGNIEPSAIPYVVNVDASTLKGFGLAIRGSESGIASRVQLVNASHANYEQYVVVGADSVDSLSELTLANGSSLEAPTAYVNVGDAGPGFVHIASTSTAKMNELNVGVFAEGNVSIDTSGLVTSDKGNLGVISGQQGTVNIQTQATWQTKDLNVGQDGIGYVYVRDHGTLKVDGAAILGHNDHGRGVLNLIGPNAKLQLGASGTLTIGDEGEGVLQLSEGAKFTSAGAVSLGKVADSSGIVTVADANSKWTVTGELTIGDRSHGAVEITNQGAVSASGTTMTLGKQASGGDGTLLIDGNGSTLDFDGNIVGGDAGKGTLRLRNSAKLTVHDLQLGKAAGSEGEVELHTSGYDPEGFVTNGDLTIGVAGRGKVTVDGGYGLTTRGEVVMGKESTSGTEEMPNTATVSGVSSAWSIHGAISVGQAANSHALIEVKDRGRILSDGPFFSVGEGANSKGRLSVVSSTQDSVAQAGINSALRVGVHGMGEVYVGDAGSLNASKVLLGVDMGGDGSVEIDGAKAKMRVFNEFEVGGAGTGKVTVKGGGQLNVEGVSSGMTIDSAPNVTTASVTVAGVNATVVSDPSSLEAKLIQVGLDGRGALTADDSGIIRTPKLQIAVNQGSHGTVTTTEESHIYADDLLEAGLGGDAQINVTGGTISAKQITLGAFAESGSATVLVNGLGPSQETRVIAAGISAYNKTSITVNLFGQIHLRPGGKFQMGGSVAHPATLTVSGGDVDVESSGAGSFEPGVFGRAIVNVNSGKIKIPDIAVGAASASVLAGSQLNVNGAGSLVNANALVVHRGATLTAAGAAQVIVSNEATINGTVNVLGGSMLVGDVPASGTIQSGALTLTPGGILKGSGTIKGNFIAKNPAGFPNVTGARIKLGNSPGLLTVEGNATLETGSVLEMEIGGITPATQYDVLDVLGAAQIDGTVVLKFIDGFSPSTGNQFSLITGSTLSLAPSVVVRNLAPGWQYSVAQTGGAWTVTSLNNGVFVEDGDFNEDGHVDGADLTAWKNGFGVVAGATHLQGDADANFNVDGADLVRWQRQVHVTSPATGVPEPSAFFLAILGAAAAVCGTPTSRRR